MAINFDLGDLQAFAAVAETGNFRKAAEIVPHLAAGLQPAHRQARRGAGRASAGPQHAQSGAHRRGARLCAQRAAARRSGHHAAGHPRSGGHTHGRGHGCLRALGGCVLPAAGHQAIPRKLPQHPREDHRRGRQRRAHGGDTRRGGFRAQLHRQQRGRCGLRAAARGALRGGLSARPRAGAASQRGLERAARVRLHDGGQVLRQPPVDGPGAGQRAATPGVHLRSAPCDDAAGPGGSRPAAWRRYRAWPRWQTIPRWWPCR